MSGEESPLPFTIRDLPEHAISRRRPGVPLHLCRSANTIFFLKERRRKDAFQAGCVEISQRVGEFEPAADEV